MRASKRVNNNPKNDNNNSNSSNINGNKNKNVSNSNKINVTKLLNNVLNKLLKPVNIRQPVGFRQQAMKRQDWYHKRVPGLKKLVNDYHDDSLAEYVYGLFHPDAVYRENLNIKAPSILPIPTTNFAFKETFTISPNALGNFLLVWSPNYLGESGHICKLAKVDPQWNNGYFSNIYWDDSPELDGNSMAGTYKAQVFKHITQNFNKYRLTSACIKVKYTGQVLQQSGMISACASFMEFPRSIITVPKNTEMPAQYTIPNLYPQLQRLGDFDTIRQGQWAKTVNIVDEPSGITCVYIPTDTMSQAFVDNSDTITAKDITNQALGVEGSTGVVWYSRSANISFDICGYGINQNQDIPCITVETYYNYEIIMNEDQLPFFRPTVSNISKYNADQVSALVNKVSSTVGTITTTKQHDQPGVVSKIANAVRNAYNYMEPYLAVAKLGAMFI